MSTSEKEITYDENLNVYQFSVKIGIIVSVDEHVFFAPRRTHDAQFLSMGTLAKIIIVLEEWKDEQTRIK